MNNDIFWAAFEDEIEKIAAGIGAAVGKSVPTLSSTLPKSLKQRWLGAPTPARSEAAASLTEDRAKEGPAYGRAALEKKKGLSGVQEGKETQRSQRKPSLMHWQIGQADRKVRSAQVIDEPTKHSPAAVEAAHKEVRRAPLFARIPGKAPEVRAAKAKKRTDFANWMASKQPVSV